MPSFPKPDDYVDFNLQNEINALKNYRDNKPGRQIPVKQNDKVLIATWNIANLGLQKRNDKEYQLIAELISWFDIIAIQETNDKLEGLKRIQSFLPYHWKAVFTDKAGNNERMAFLYDSNKVQTLEKYGEVAVPPKDIKYIKINGINEVYKGFDRNPFLVSFKAGNLSLILVNVHLYYGSPAQQDVERRALEAYAVSRWADLRRDSVNRYLDHIIVLGDFNLPVINSGDPVYDALRKRGLRIPEHSTMIASNISDDKYYDQIMFFPGESSQEFTGNMGVFDFDGALLNNYWNAVSRTKFLAYLRYYFSDHRLMWAEFKI